MVGGQVDVSLGGTAMAVALGDYHGCAILVSGVSTVEGRGGVQVQDPGRGDAHHSLEVFRDSGAGDSGAGAVGIRQTGCGGCCLGMGLGAGILDDIDFQVVELCADINDEAHGFVVGRV